MSGSCFSFLSNGFACPFRIGIRPARPQTVAIRAALMNVLSTLCVVWLWIWCADIQQDCQETKTNTVPIVPGYCKLKKCQSTSGGPANGLQRLMPAHHHGPSVQELRIEIKSAPAWSYSRFAFLHLPGHSQAKQPFAPFCLNYNKS